MAIGNQTMITGNSIRRKNVLLLLSSWMHSIIVERNALERSLAHHQASAVDHLMIRLIRILTEISKHFNIFVNMKKLLSILFLIPIICFSQSNRPAMISEINTKVY